MDSIKDKTKILINLENYWYFVEILVGIRIIFDNLLKFLTILASLATYSKFMLPLVCNELHVPCIFGSHLHYVGNDPNQT